MGEVIEGTRRLYLAKGDTLDIHIDASLPQHQIEGIRFLYRLFSKKKPGAILNDPSGYGKRVQTVLFLGAVRALLDKPVLVLCREGKEQKWVHRFNKWTRIGMEVSIQQFNPPVLKSFVYINPMTHVNTFARREWSVVIVDDTSIARDVLRASLNTQFKIWLTCMDMKKSLQTFSLIYKWIYPKDKFNVEDFQVFKKKPSIVHIKSIILDAFMEDIVLRRKAEYPPFGKFDESIRNPPKVTRKNKDATGKKIKRSKRTQEELKDPINNVPSRMAKEIIENFIINLQNYSQNNMDVDNMEVDEAFQRQNSFVKEIKRMGINEFCKSPLSRNNEIEKDDNAKGGEGISYAEHNSEPNEYGSCNLLDNDNIPTQDIVIKYDSDSHDLNKTENNELNNVETHTNEADNELTHTNEAGNNELTHKNDLDNVVSHKNDLNVTDKNELDNEVTQKNDTAKEVTCNNDKESADLFADSDEIVHDVKDINSNSKNAKCEQLKNGVSNGDGIVKLVEEVKSDDLENKVSDKKTEPEMGSVEMKMKELEEITMKKFKGTLLDSIF